MRKIKIISITLATCAVIIISSCHSSKKSLTSAVPFVPVSAISNPDTTSATASSTLPLPSKSSDGIYEPGTEELTAIQVQFKDVTLNKLKQGHAIYTFGACIKCHSPVNIYKRPEAQWKNIIEDMAQKAEISEAQKDAVYKYVLSIKAVQSK